MALTEAEHDVEKDDEYHRDAVDKVTDLTHPKRARWNIASSSKHVRQDSKCVRSRAEDDEGSDKISEGRLAAQLDSSKCSTKHG